MSRSLTKTRKKKIERDIERDIERERERDNNKNNDSNRFPLINQNDLSLTDTKVGNETASSSNANSETILLMGKKDNILKEISVDSAILDIYYQRYRIPTENELLTWKSNGKKVTVDELKKKLSMTATYIPLYDVFTSNMYVIQQRNVYIRVVNHDYRFPDKLIIDSIHEMKEKKMKRLKKKPELEKDKVFMRSLHKIELMTDFMSQFDMEILYETYLRIFYKFAPEFGNITYTCIRRSFMPHKAHLRPYYTKDEVLKLGMNMELIKLPKDTTYIDFKDNLTNDDFRKICTTIQKNDIHADILLHHQNYIIDNDMVGLIQYYTMQGSYFMNKYLRGMTNHNYRDDYLEENIIKVWKLILNSPSFDNEYILYRFIADDSFLSWMNVGDIFVDKGFMSTTRDPFYHMDKYKFGFILMKIKIPKSVRGVGLCLETISHFPDEEEIILPPSAKLKLLSKDDACEYYHPDENFVSEIKTKYEFEWIGNSDVIIDQRDELQGEYKTKVIDFLKINKIYTMSVKEKTQYLLRTYFDPMHRIRCKIGDKEFYVSGEWYDSTGAYENKYALKTTDGFMLYSLYQGYFLFAIEIGEVNDIQQIRVNYHSKYTRINRQELLGDENFIHFIASIANYYDIPNIIIQADTMSCDSYRKKKYDYNSINSDNQNIMKRSKVLISSMHRSLRISNNSQSKRSIYSQPYPNSKLYPKNYKQGKTKRLHGPNVTEGAEQKVDGYEKGEEYDEEYSGGVYCLDFYRYLKYDEKRYRDSKTLNAELQPMFSYYDLDLLKKTNPLNILRKEDRDEIIQFYTETYQPSTINEKHNLADFYIWMVENKCYLMDIFVNKFDRLYRKDNPFKKSSYVLDAMAYLYNRGLVNTYNRHIKMTIDDEYQILELPKNMYRIER